MSKRNRRQPWSGALDCPVCHRTVSGAPGWIHSNCSASGFWKCHSAIIHRTVRCSIGLSDVPSGATVVSSTVEFNGRLTTLQCTDRAHRVRSAPEGAPDIEQWLSGGPTCQSSNGRTLTVGWRGWRTGQCLVRPSTAAFPNGHFGGWGYKYPNHHTSRHPSFLANTFNTRASAFNTRHN
jgi:hypothetical protein